MSKAGHLSIGQCAQWACVLDVVADKPGNVSIRFPKAGMTHREFLRSAAAIAPVMERAPFRPVGKTILDSIDATRQVTNHNTNLGIVLLLAPLASVPPYAELREGVERALGRLTVDDARDAYQAIRLARPGGMGTVAEQDVSSTPTVTLREAMALAADRDLVAKQYVNGFQQVFEGVEILRGELRTSDEQLSQAITTLYLRMLARHSDSLIARKHGPAAAAHASKQAVLVLESDDEKEQVAALKSLIDGPNPGTTADFVTACLFVALRNGMIDLPTSMPTSVDSQ